MLPFSFLSWTGLALAAGGLSRLRRTSEPG